MPDGHHARAGRRRGTLALAMTATSFPFRYGALRPLMSVMGLGPGLSGIELESDVLRVRMGWAFQASIPLAQITEVRPVEGPVGGIGVHGWRGRWLVNGTTTGLVAITVDPAVRVRAVGLPVHLRVLTLSVGDPAALVAALGR
jgi:hypothetical protein